jgi:DNA helicase-2/ATP-dependent DNA helicase PcrA
MTFLLNIYKQLPHHILIMIMLNAEQKEVVYHRGSPLICFAAAGTGKTQALTCRIASLILDDQVSPEKIVALTFTRKAANEMSLVGISRDSFPYIGIFHSFCLQMLCKFNNNKTFLKLANFLEGLFSVIDAKESNRILKRVLESNSNIVEASSKLDCSFNQKSLDHQRFNMCII